MPIIGKIMPNMARNLLLGAAVIAMVPLPLAAQQPHPPQQAEKTQVQVGNPDINKIARDIAAALIEG